MTHSNEFEQHMKIVKRSTSWMAVIAIVTYVLVAVLAYSFLA